RTEDPREMLRLTARILRQIRERCGDIVNMARQGASTDERLASTLAEGIRRRHAALATITQTLHSHKALRDGLDPQTAADIAAALLSDEICDVLVDQRHWSYDRYERWLADALAQQLLHCTQMSPLRRGDHGALAAGCSGGRLVLGPREAAVSAMRDPAPGSPRS